MSRFFIILLVFIFSKTNSQHELALRVGDSLYAMGNYAAAITAFKKIPTNISQQEKIAKSYMALGNTLQAISIYKKLTLQNPDALIAKKKYATLLYTAAKYEESKKVFTELQMQNFKNPNIYYYLGLIKEKQGDTTAIENFKMALYLNPEYSDAIYKAAKLNVQKQRFFNAAGFIEKGLKIAPESTRFLILKGLSAYYKKEYHETIETFSKVIALGKNTEQIHDCLAISYAKTFQYKKAIEHYSILLTFYNDKNPNYQYNLGKCYMGINAFKKGRTHVKNAIALLDVSLHNEYVTLAAGYSREQMYQESFASLKRAIKDDATSQKAHYQLAVAADNFYKDDAEVLKLYENYIKLFGESGRYYDLVYTRARDLKEALFIKNNK